MDGNQSPELTQILNAIKEGGFGRDELVQRLHALIDRELTQNDRPADMELVDACQDILYRLHHQGGVYVSNNAASLVKAQAKQRRRKLSLPAIRPISRVAAILILLFGGALLFDLFISGDHLTAKPTSDEQQYVIEGVEINSLMTAEGDAATSVIPRVISTSSLHEAVTAFGYSPAMPTWLPRDWILHDYYVAVTSDLSLFRAKYMKPGEDEFIKYTVNIYPDANIANASIEQEMNGKTYSINNNTVYVTNNLGSTVALWLTDHIFYTVSGPISEPGIIQIVESILGSG